VGGGAEALELMRKMGTDDGVLLLDPMLQDLEPNEFHGIVRNRFPNAQVFRYLDH
jgi:hypothetical protein